MFETKPDSSFTVPSVEQSEAALLSSLADLPASSHYLVALSGGLDSTVLLRLLTPALVARGASVKAIHVHHGYSQNADGWVRFCQSMCNELGVECLIERVRVEPDGEGWEAAARKARYRAFESHLPKGGVLLLGHHQDDQIETLVMRVRRQKDIATLAGMPRQRRLAEGLLVRPWLSYARVHLENVARWHGWSWVEDESNRDSNFERNWVRNTLIPVMKELDLYAEQRVIAIAEAASELALLTQRLMKPLLLLIKDEAMGSALNITRLVRLSESAQHLVLRVWLGSLGVRQPSKAIFCRIWSELLPASPDAAPELRWGGTCLRRYRQTLYLVNANDLRKAVPEAKTFFIDELPVCLNFAGYELRVKFCEKPQASAAKQTAELDYLCLPKGAEHARVGARHGGEKIALDANAGSTSLKKLFALQGVPPWERSVRPLLWLGGRLAWAGPGFVAAEFGENRPDESCRWISIEFARLG